MSCHLYNWKKVKDAAVIAICDSTEDADKLMKFGWASTVALDDEDSQPVSWGLVDRSKINLADELRGRRILLFPHVTVDGQLSSSYAIVRLIERSIDIRVVRIPIGETVVGFLATIRTATEANRAIQKLIDHAISLTSWEAAEIDSSLRVIKSAIEKQTGRGWWKLDETLVPFEAAFRTLQKMEAARRAHHMKENAGNEGRKPAPERIA